MSNIGHNNPPDPIEQFTAEHGDFLGNVQHWLDGSPIETDAQLAATDADLKELKAVIKAAEALREAETKPLHDAWKAAIARFKPLLDDLGRMRDALVALQDPYKRALQAKKEAEKRAAWEAAEAKRIEAERIARAAAASDIEAQREADRAAQAAQDAMAAASGKSKDRVKGMRRVLRFEVVDHRAALHWIARHDRDAVTAFVDAYVARNHKTATIDGVVTREEMEAF